jgi:integrase
VRIYFRRKGQPKVRIYEPVGSAEFVVRYQQLCDGIVSPSNENDISRPTPGTWRWLCTQYFASARFRDLDATTQRKRRATLESTFVEPIYSGAMEVFADMPFGRMTGKAVRILRDRKGAGLPAAANQRVKAISTVFAWAIEHEIAGVTINPARDVAHFRASGTGHHAWTPDEVEQYQRHYPIGTKARLALALFLYTGARVSDAVRLGKQHSRDGWFRFKQHKNRNRHPIEIEIPILAELQAIIDASPTGDLTYLVTEHGRPFSIAGFGNKFRDWCNAAGLPHCSAHGLRKAGATRAAENGATEHQLMAIFGWKTIQETERYTKSARRKMMAGDAMKLLRGGKS